MSLKALASHISGAVDRCISFLCKSSTFATPDDKSGVRVNGKTFPTFLDMGGDMYYFDDKGDKVYLTDEQKKNDLVNVNEKFLGHVVRCYNTGSGVVRLMSHISYNDVMGVRSEMHYILRSTDVQNKVGKVISSIPSGWTPSNCSTVVDGFSVTEREECYGVPDGVGHLTVLARRSFDVELNVVSERFIVQSSGAGEYPIGMIMDDIPEPYVRVSCFSGNGGESLT